MSAVACIDCQHVRIRGAEGEQAFHCARPVFHLVEGPAFLHRTCEAERTRNMSSGHAFGANHQVCGDGGKFFKASPKTSLGGEF